MPRTCARTDGALNHQGDFHQPSDDGGIKRTFA
jgi:hypothetical protein